MEEGERKDKAGAASAASGGAATRLDDPGSAADPSATRLENDPPARDAARLESDATQLDSDATRLEVHGEASRVPLMRGASAVRLRSGDVIDERFVLDEELGRGGMSIVYRARDLIKEQAGDPNPYVALKILNGDFSRHPDAWIALQQEISKTQSLAHPRIVTVHDFEIDKALGLPFAQMEVMRGESLQDLINRHPEGLQDPQRVVDIVMAIAEGLAYAHSRGIVHADMKPSNVFITDEGEIKILDFGIARFVPGARSTGGRPSNEVFGEGGMNALTPFYASPEAFAGEAPHPSDDLFALGIIAMLLGTGKHPFASTLSEAQPSVAAAARGLAPKRISGMRASQWRALAACLSYERARRPEDGNQFLQAFRPRSIWLRLLTALSVILAVAVVVAVLRGEQKRPEVPFEELPPATQEQIVTALESGDLALRMRDLNGALFYYADAFELHPYNERATDGLQEVMDQVIAAPIPSDPGDLRRRIQQVRALQEYPALAESRALHKHLDELQALVQP